MTIQKKNISEWNDFFMDSINVVQLDISIFCDFPIQSVLYGFFIEPNVISVCTQSWAAYSSDTVWRFNSAIVDIVWHHVVENKM